MNENIIDNIIELIMTGFQPVSCIGLDERQLRVIELEIVLGQLNVSWIQLNSDDLFEAVHLAQLVDSRTTGDPKDEHFFWRSRQAEGWKA